MIAVIYLLLCFGVGYVICRLCFPNMRRFGRYTYDGTQINETPLFLCLPAWLLFGTLPMTWLTYGLGMVFRNCKQPLLYANMIVMPVAAIGIVTALFLLKRTQKENFREYFRNLATGELFYFAFVASVFLFLLWWTFFSRNGKYYVGWTVASDFAPHIGMIRSFAVGNNFPTGYSHFAGSDIKYHFMYQFFVGNLNFLGLRLDFAFNVPSLLFLVNAVALLYFYAVKLTGRRAVGMLTGVLFMFRSSSAFLDFAASIPKKTGFLKGLLSNREFIGTTEHEDWGLWNLNVYCNQRHLAIGLCVILFVLIYFTQYLIKGTQRCREGAEKKLYKFLSENPNEELLFGETAEYLIKESLFRREGWITPNWTKAIACGILLGLCSFFNGACVIACLSVLFVMAFVSDHRLEYALTAAITVAMSVLSTRMFMEGSAVNPKFFFGFLSPNGTLFSVIKYLVTLCGILPILLLISLTLCSRAEKYLVFAFSAPVILAFTVSLTIDISVNHKYVMIGIMLLCIPVANLIDRLWRKKGSYVKFLAALLLFCLTVSGIYDFTVIMKRNDAKTGNVVMLDEDSDICRWVMENSDSHDIFLTNWYSLNDYVLGGAMLYYGWPYYAWSAGYDTYARERLVYAMYEASTPEELDSLVEQCNIRFIVVDNEVREREEFLLDEENIIRTYGLVFNDGNTRIFDTREKLFK